MSRPCLFYPKLAATGIKKNKRLYLPFLITCAAMTMMLYIMLYLARNETLAAKRMGLYTQLCLQLGIIVITIFSVIFLFYSYSVIIKNRGREFGLYNILGMNKRNIALVLIWESIYTAVFSLVAGLAAGMLLSKLAELSLFKLLGIEAEDGLMIDFMAAGIACIIFAAILLLLLLYSFIRIQRYSAIQLLQSKSAGEKPPRANIFTALLGLVLLVIAYYLAVTCEAGPTAILIFFIAVIMVIIATYMLFVSGSVALCRVLMKNKRYYYKSNHFISVSTMAYRMKRNGAGLASICILSTMVLVMLSSTISLFSGIQTSPLLYSRDITVEVRLRTVENYVSDKLRDMCGAAYDTAKQAEFNPHNILSYDSLGVGSYIRDGHIYIKNPSAEDNVSQSEIRELVLITLSDYNRLENKDVTLGENEVLIYSEQSVGDTLYIDGLGECGVKTLNNVPAGLCYGEMAYPVIIAVVPDFEAMYSVFLHNLEQYGDNCSYISRYYAFDIDRDGVDENELCEEISNNLVKIAPDDGLFFYVDTKSERYEMLVSTYGGMLFLGILLGTVFVFATVLILYYKQISEGYEDRSRFEVMRSIGMTEKEIKRSINSQVLTVFFAPIAAAGVHLCFAFPLIYKTIRMLGFADSSLLALSNVICFAVFAVFYILAYRITSGVYLKIIGGKKSAQS